MSSNCCVATSKMCTSKDYFLQSETFSMFEVKRMIHFQTHWSSVSKTVALHSNEKNKGILSCKGRSKVLLMMFWCQLCCVKWNPVLWCICKMLHGAPFIPHSINVLLCQKPSIISFNSQQWLCFSGSQQSLDIECLRWVRPPTSLLLM